jgi:aminoglycoside phosphotransferase (APT) family kinase protein
MSTGKMHVDELNIDISLVGRLLAAQFPQWADLPIEPIHSAGTDNAIFRLGDEMTVRLPRIQNATLQVGKEHQWLPRLTPHLPLAIPVPLAKGTPGEDYPWQWSIYQWIEGENATIKRIADPGQAARDLAHFIAALQRIDPKDGPTPGPHNSFRGEPLAMRDAETRTAIASLDGMLDIGSATAAWETALHSPAWLDPPVWIHGDLSPLNLLVKRGRISAIIDFGCLGVGDPACDLQVAWNLLSAQARDIFHAELPIDDAMWARGRGWALSVGLIALPYYQSTNPVLAGISRHTIDEVLADYNHSVRPSSMNRYCC